MILSIKGKLLILVGAIIIVYSCVMGYVLIRFKQELRNDAEKITESYLRQNANEVRTIFNQDFGIARTLSSTFESTSALDQDNREYLTTQALTSAIKQDKRYLSTWLTIELSAINPEWTLPYGRLRYTHYYEGPPETDSVNLTGDTNGSLYHQLKVSGRELLSEPYLLSSTSTIADERANKLGTSICAPLLRDGKFIGVTGMDIELNMFDFITTIKPFEDASTFLISHEGTLVAHEDKTLIGKSITQLFSQDSALIMKHITEGTSLTLINDALNNTESLIVIAPVFIARTNMPWAIATVVPVSTLNTSIDTILWQTIALSLAGLVLLIGFVLWVANRISRPVQLVKMRLSELAQGNINAKNITNINSRDELGDMIQSVNQLTQSLDAKVRFATDIGAGNLDTSFDTVSADDTLGNALLTMRHNLKQIKADDEIRSWTSEGLGKLNEVLRITNTNTDEYYLNGLRNLLNYVKAKLGAIFLVDEEDSGEKYIELVAAYAYERKKFLEKRIAWGEGVIGQCILEGELVYMKKIPTQYLHITSGLGEAIPRELIIAPLKTESEILGALELASFHEFKPHEIDFIKKVCEIMAASINSYRNNFRTQKLLEKARANEQQMREAEEEMRQNLEEMEATQETMTRTQSELQDNQLKLNYFINGTGDSIIMFDTRYKIVLINDILKKRYKGTEYEMFVGDNILDKLGNTYDYWKPKYDQVLAGEKLEFSIQSQLKTETTTRQYVMSPIFDELGKVKYALIRTNDVRGKEL